MKPYIHCYNIYGVISELKIEESTNNRGEKFVTATGVISDETGSANFRLKNEHTPNLKNGATVAMRNGKSMLI